MSVKILENKIIILHCFVILCVCCLSDNAYTNIFFKFTKYDMPRVHTCIPFGEDRETKNLSNEINSTSDSERNSTFTSTSIDDIDEDPYETLQKNLHKFLYGDDVDCDDVKPNKSDEEKNVRLFLKNRAAGNVYRAELYQNKSGVHLSSPEHIHQGYYMLNITSDYMQTAVNAFSIFLYGSIQDILRLPHDYVLRSARTISMMKIAREKLVATWDVVKNGRKTRDIPYQTLEMYRPLFKYLNGREMARLNLKDERILSYIGTHIDLNRHQVGIIASRYININPKWAQSKYLNLMNNLLCGVPIVLMRQIPESTYLQLSNQVFYHIRACDSLQRRFYLTMMSKTQALGKANSWTANDVSRLGLLLGEVDGEDLAAINPPAIAGIAAQVMSIMSATNLKHLTDEQIQYLGQKSLNILAKKMNTYNDLLQISNATGIAFSCMLYSYIVVLFIICFQR